MLIKNTKIVCTLGPATEDKKNLTALILSGMNVARLNFSHGNYKNFKKIIRNLRSVSRKLKIPVAIMQDLQGPKIRVGKMPKGGIVLLSKEKVTLTITDITGDHKIIPIQYKKLPQEVQKGDTIMLCDGTIELEVTRVQKNTGKILCVVVSGGVVQSHKGLNVPTASISAPAFTEKDRLDLIFGLKQGVDYVAMSFVKEAKEITKLREFIHAQKKDAKIITKIERHEAVKNLKSIIEVSDGVMVARGDLGTEIPAEKVPIIQKKIIRLANIQGIPVITATEILQSMISNPRATRAEVSDAANAVIDHTDALMLSNETAVGKYPIEAVQTLSKTALETEKYLSGQEDILKNRIRNFDLPIVNSICFQACALARDINAKYIVVLTDSGYTSRQVVKNRPYIPVIVITPSEKTRRELSLVWGINRTFTKKTSFKKSSKRVKKLLLKNRLVNEKDEIVIVNADEKESFLKTIVI